MNYIDFKDYYPDEQSCKLAYKGYRLEQGVICKKCGSKDHYWLSSKEMFQCKNNTCRFRTSLKSGTVMENSKLSFYQWFLTMHLMTASKLNISAIELQRQLRHRYYSPVFYMVQKLRLVMGKRDSGYILEGLCELDEGYFTHTDPLTVNEFTDKQEELKRGKGSQKKTKVLVVHSVQTAKLALSNREYKHDTIPKYLKMTVIDDQKSKTIDKAVKSTFKPTAKLITDDNKAYTNLKNLVNNHQPHNVSKVNAVKILPWVHKAISNSKSTLLAVHKGVSHRYMQNYLNEFCFKYNRRAFGEKIMERLLIAAVATTWH